MVPTNCGDKLQTYEQLNKGVSDGGQSHTQFKSKESYFDPKQEERTGAQTERSWSSWKREAK